MESLLTSPAFRWYGFGVEWCVNKLRREAKNIARRGVWYSRAGLFKWWLCKIAGGREQGSIVMKLSAQSNKRQAWTLEFQAEPQTREEANRRRGIGTRDEGWLKVEGLLRLKNDGHWNGRELKSLWIRDGLNGNCFEAWSTNHRSLFNCPLRLVEVYEINWTRQAHWLGVSIIINRSTSCLCQRQRVAVEGRILILMMEWLLRFAWLAAGTVGEFWCLCDWFSLSPSNLCYS